MTNKNNIQVPYIKMTENLNNQITLAKAKNNNVMLTAMCWNNLRKQQK